jgi:hypothetical protein
MSQRRFEAGIPQILLGSHPSGELLKCLLTPSGDTRKITGANHGNSQEGSWEDVSVNICLQTYVLHRDRSLKVAVQGLLLWPTPYTYMYIHTYIRLHRSP